MFFNFIRLIFFILISTVKLSYHMIILIAKLIYFISSTLYNLIKYILHSNKLRFPCALFLIGTILRINIIILFSMYYLYLINIFAIKNNFYSYIYNKISLKYNEYRNGSIVIKILKSLTCENMIINNTLLDSDENSIYIYHLVITPNGIYNILPYSTNFKFIDALTLKNLSDFKALIEDIFPFKVPVFNILAVNSENDTVLVSDYPFKILPLDSVADYIENSPYKKINKSISHIASVVLENKVWLIDKILGDFFTIIKNNTKVVLFFLFCPIVYIIYIATLMFLTQVMTEISQTGLQTVIKLLQP